MIVTDLDRGIEHLAALIEASHRIMVFTGAGISTASGIPDYRGPQGVWNTRRPVFYDEFMGSADDRVATGSRSPRIGICWTGQTEPGARCHRLLEQAGRIEAVVTQNVDGLHSMAGTSGAVLVELHGTVRSIECQSCGERTDPASAFVGSKQRGDARMCGCGGYLKPATISFGQALRSSDMVHAAAAADRCDLAISLGSTLSVTPAALIPVSAAERGVPYAIVNRGATEHDRLNSVTLRIEGDVSAVFPAAVGQALADRAPNAAR